MKKTKNVGTAARVAMAAMLALAAAGPTAMQSLAADTIQPCAKANTRLAATGKGDKDHDGLGDCSEKKVLGTDPRDYDSDDDGVADGAEVAGGTNPIDDDSDDDGIDDGDEVGTGTDPLDDDSDDDGIEDGSDADPAHELRSEIKGALQTLSCADNTLTVLGIAITLTADTEYEGAASCDDLATKLAANGGAHVEVEVTGDATTALVALEVSLEDADNDGSPDDVDDDDDNDGSDDDEHDHEDDD